MRPSLTQTRPRHGGAAAAALRSAGARKSRGVPTSWAVLIALAGLSLASPAPAQHADYAREQRWAQEITPAILDGEVVNLELESGRKFLAIHTPAARPHAAVIVVHGMGLHPDWGLVHALRTELPQAGYTTLSLQMPVLAADARPEDYAVTFAEASERLSAGTRWLRLRGHESVAIVAHSMGARMSNRFLIEAPQPAISAWVSIGLSGPFAGPAGLRLPVLDLYGERDLAPVLAAADQRAETLRRLPRSSQVQVSGADHFFTDREGELLTWVRRFLGRALAR